MRDRIGYERSGLLGGSRLGRGALTGFEALLNDVSNRNHNSSLTLSDSLKDVMPDFLQAAQKYEGSPSELRMVHTDSNLGIRVVASTDQILMQRSNVVDNGKQGGVYLGSSSMLRHLGEQSLQKADIYMPIVDNQTGTITGFKHTREFYN